ncbi:MAG: SCO family protein [Alphaproteobacteria bacterium]|nr:SCO family protein [Alphaproteobacteria bacterium]
MRKFRLILWFAAATAVALFAAFYVMNQKAPRPVSETDRVQTAEEIARAIVTGEFALVDARGQPVADTDFRGSWLLIFFGFTHCPDVCPTTLGTVALVMDELGTDGDALQPLFITVDPARDTPDVMGAYVAAFHPRIIGLTGSEEQIAAAAKSHRAYYAKVPASVSTGTGTDDYAMDHSAHLYLMDPDGLYATAFSQTDTIEAMARNIRERVARK